MVSFNISSLLQASVFGAIVAFLGIMVYSRSINKKIKSEAHHLDTENITVYATAANTLLEPLRKQLEETQKEADGLRTTVKELNREIAAQSLIVEELTDKLDRAVQRADYYQSEYERLAGLPLTRKSTPPRNHPPPP